MLIKFYDEHDNMHLLNFVNITTQEEFEINCSDIVSVYEIIERKQGFKPVRHEFDDNLYLCKYCNNLCIGKDHDVLCPDCKSTFGHTYYSEL